jgi:hypothetical protein
MARLNRCVAVDVEQRSLPAIPAALTNKSAGMEHSVGSFCQNGYTRLLNSKAGCHDKRFCGDIAGASDDGFSSRVKGGMGEGEYIGGCLHSRPSKLLH